MITTHQEQGPREYQEDFFFAIEKDVTVLAVFDGHCGAATAKHCSLRLGRLILETSASLCIEDGLRLICSELAKECSGHYSGTTVSIAVIFNNIATIAVIGDSPILAIDADGETNLSPEHNVRSNPKSVAEVVERGGHVFDGYAWNKGTGLQMSRAIGDAGMGKVINNQPDIYSVHLGEKSVVLVASDGVFDPGHSDKLRPAQIAHLLRTGADAKAVIESAGELRDNATAIVWRKP